MPDPRRWTPTRRALLASTALLAAGSARAEAPDDKAGDKIRPIVLLSKPQANDPSLFQAAQLVVQQWKRLGLNI